MSSPTRKPRLKRRARRREILERQLEKRTTWYRRRIGVLTSQVQRLSYAFEDVSWAALGVVDDYGNLIHPALLSAGEPCNSQEALNS